jgi:hypothetical protein
MLTQNSYLAFDIFSPHIKPIKASKDPSPLNLGDNAARHGANAAHDRQAPY